MSASIGEPFAVAGPHGDCCRSPAGLRAIHAAPQTVWIGGRRMTFGGMITAGGPSWRAGLLLAALRVLLRLGWIGTGTEISWTARPSGPAAGARRCPCHGSPN